jgi:prepilin-type N-terminal cleavage/methylation domain-containing protein/prepilin-type processing-associated H-X9-DG protein
MKSRTAFTLIELLVVIAIIAVLAGLLLPALAMAKRKAHHTVCTSNFKQWGVAMHSFIDGNENHLPRERGVNGTHSWEAFSASTNSDVWCNAVPREAGKPGAGDYASNYQTRAEFYSRSSFFYCPSARFLPLDPTAPPCFSLAMNSKLILVKESVYENFSRAERNSSQTVLLVETGVPGEKPATAWQAQYDGRCYADGRRFSVRHQGKGNLLFCDGSVSSWPARKVVPLPSGGDFIEPQVELIWRPDP